MLGPAHTAYFVMSQANIEPITFSKGLFATLKISGKVVKARRRLHPMLSSTLPLVFAVGRNIAFMSENDPRRVVLELDPGAKKG